MKIVYVLTSDCNDIYADMTLISLWSLRQSNPKAYIILICDENTVEAIEQHKHRIAEEPDEIISVKVPRASPGFRNRYIKTTIRQRLDGLFLYLDSDTLVRGDLDLIFTNDALLAGVPNHNETVLTCKIPISEIQIFEKMGWDLSSNYYVNGGVLLFADSPEVHKFCNLWHEKWLECSSKMGIHRDQPSLNSAIHESKIDFTWLDHRYNAQVHARPNKAWQAVIWHIYLSDLHASPKTVMDKAIKDFRNKNSLSAADISKYCRYQHPWLIQNPLDWLAVYCLNKDSRILGPNRWERLWLANQYGLSFLELFRQIFHTMHNLLRSLKSVKSG